MISRMSKMLILSSYYKKKNRTERIKMLSTIFFYSGWTELAFE